MRRNWSSKPSTHFSNITQSSADIECLAVPYSMYAVRPFAETFPLVKSLCIMGDECDLPKAGPVTNADNDASVNLVMHEYHFDSISAKWPPAPSVLSLELRAYPETINIPPCRTDYILDLEFQRNLIPQLTVAFPNVRKIRFGPYIEWTRQPSEETWSGFIPLDLHDRIRFMLNHKRHPVHYKDVDHLLEPFLSL
ncbi:hypothetical protein C0991_009572 [Blastosporella zonata]|nr:hypothetical protein C0991_009572 [Blastosporella zonata]